MKIKLIYAFVVFFLVVKTTNYETVIVERNPSNYFSCYESIMQFMDPEVFYGASTMKFVEANSLSALEKAYGEESFFSIQGRLEQSIIKQQNLNLRKHLKESPLLPASDTKATYLTKAEADSIYEAMVTNKVVKDGSCYDSGGVGFCFGRAMVAHVESLLRGVHPSALKKVWIVGDMGFWGHHVALMVKSKDSWYVIDNFVYKVVTIDEWMTELAKQKKNGAKDVMFFVTQAERFGPEHSKAYNPIDFFNSNFNGGYSRDNDFYKGFFHDFFEDAEARLKNTPNFPAR